MTSGGAFGYNVGEGNEIMNERLNEVLESKEVLIFDFDGTMTGTEHFNYLVHKKNWKKYGIDLTEDEYKKVMGKTVVDLDNVSVCATSAAEQRRQKDLYFVKPKHAYH